MQGKLAEVVATKEELAQLGLDKVKQLQPSSVVRIVDMCFHESSWGDIVEVDDGDNRFDYFEIPLKLLRIIEN